MEGKYICTCMDILYTELKKTILEQNLTTLEEVQEKTGAGTVCGSCIDDILALLEEIKTNNNNV